MSNRTIEQVNELAALKLSHELQIEALTAPGLSDEERVRRFGEAAGFNEYLMQWSLDRLSYESPACAVWYGGEYERSLFGNLPGCSCPVGEVLKGRANFPGIPSYIPNNWSPTRPELEAFARVQQERRFP